MKNFLHKILGWKINENGISIDLFSVWHFLYIFLILTAIFVTALILNKKSEKARIKFLRGLSIFVLVFYIIDFMLQPFVSDNFTLNIDKLPFHICTLMGIMAVIAQYSNKAWFKELIVIMASAGCIMYLTYPGTALGGISPWSYKVVQTMIYHGALLAWGVLSLTTGQVKLHWKNLWILVVGLTAMTIWAYIGNVCYEDYDWFFITGSTFPFVPKWLMPFAVIVSVFGVSCLIYLIYWSCQKIKILIDSKKLKEDKLNDK